jgi:subtilisin-like proprotein convertase family protein
MKFLLHFFAAAALLGAAPVRGASFTNTVNQIIPDGNPAGMSSTITVSGINQPIADVNVTLNLSGGYNGDIYAYLSYGGSSVVLLNRVGKTASNPFGYDDIGLNIRLDDQAAADIHTYGGNGGLTLTGDWQPDGRITSPQFVLDTDPRATSLSVFNNMDANGQWTIFFADMSGGDNTTMTLMDWSLEVTPVPEPGNLVLLFLAGLAGVRFFARKNRNR